MVGTNEFAEDLTGQRMPVNASQWRSETRVGAKIWSVFKEIILQKGIRFSIFSAFDVKSESTSENENVCFLQFYDLNV